MRNRSKMSVTLLCLAIRVLSILENRQQRYFRHCQTNKKVYTIFDSMRHKQTARLGLYIDKGGKPINRPSTKRKL